MSLQYWSFILFRLWLTNRRKEVLWVRGKKKWSNIMNIESVNPCATFYPFLFYSVCSAFLKYLLGTVFMEMDHLQKLSAVVTMMFPDTTFCGHDISFMDTQNQQKVWEHLLSLKNKKIMLQGSVFENPMKANCAVTILSFQRYTFSLIFPSFCHNALR